MPNVYSQLSIQHFGDGLNTDHPTSIPDHALAKAENIQYTQEKKVAPKPGMQKRFGSNFDTNPVIGIAPYYKSDGTTRLVMAAGTTLYQDTPHLIFNYDSQTEWQSGTTNLDTASVAGDLKLPTVPASPKYVSYQRGKYGLGASINTMDDHVYGLQGGTNAFYRNYTQGDKWDYLAALPLASGAGASIASAGDYAYAIRGGGTTDFFRSSLSTVAVSQATFSRSSVAYKTDGTQVASGVPRYETGAFSQALHAESGTTNLLTANQASVETDTTGFTSQFSATVTRDTVEHWHGTASLKVQTPGSAVNEGVYLSVPTAFTASTAYTGSLWVKGSGTVECFLWDGATHFATATVTLTSAWQRVVFSGTSGASITASQFYVWTSGSAQAVTFYIDGLQLEQKAFPTSWQLPSDGARAAESFTIQKGGVFLDTSGTLEGRIKLLRSPGTNEQFVFDGAGALNKNLVLKVNTSGKLVCEYGTGSSTITITGTTTLVKDTVYHVAGKWASGGVTLYLNGAPEGSSATAPSLTFGGNVYLGSKSDSTLQLGGLLDDFRVSKIARTDADILAAYQTSAPLPVDADTTYKLTFDNTLSASTTSWTAMAALPVSATTGASLVYTGGDYLYATVGGTAFYRYSISGNSWTAMTAAPVSFGAGASLAYTNGDFIYALQGGGTGFYRYSISGNSWTSLAVAATIGDGGSLAWDGSNLIYALQGGATTGFNAYSISAGTWSAMAAVPAAVGAGGSLSWDGGDSFYAVRGGNTFNVYRYSTTANAWVSVASASSAIGVGGAATVSPDFLYVLQGGAGYLRYALPWKKISSAPVTFGAGAALCRTYGDYLYALQGGTTTGFYRYSLSGKSWTAMTSVPLSIADGGALVYTGGDYIYASRGGGAEFYRYSISGNSWAAMASAATFGAGASLVWTSGDYIYAATGNGTTNFYRYSISGNAWVAMAAAPSAAGAGGSLTWSGGDFIYLVHGGNTTTFSRYSISGNSWASLTAIPVAVTTGGGSSFAGGDYIHLIQGTSFYRYSISAGTWSSALTGPPNAFGSGASLGSSSSQSLSYTPSKTLPAQHFGAVWFRPAANSAALANTPLLMSLYNASNVQRYALDYSAGAFHFKKISDSTYSVDATTGFSKGDTVFLAWLDDPVAGNMKLWVGINGLSLTEYTLANAVQITDATKVHWGGGTTTGSEANGVLDDIQLYDVSLMSASNAPFAQSFVDAIYTSGVSQTWGLFTLLHSTLAGTTDVDANRQGVWVSPSQNGSTSSDKSTLSVTWTADVLVNTTLSAQVATSADGVAWSAWYDQTNGAFATAPANTYSKVRFILQEVGNAGTPTLHVATASYDGTPSATTLLSGLAVSNHYAFAQLQDTLVACNGVDIPKQFNGTTATDLTQAPRASVVCVYKNRMFMAKDANNKSRVYFSALADITDWTTANNAGLIDVNANDGDEIMALVPMDTTLLVVKGHASYYLQGYSPQTFQVTPAGNGGTLSPNGVIWTQYGVFRLDREGVWATNFATQVLLTKEKGIQKIWDGLNQRQLSKAALFMWQDKLLVAVPDGNSAYNNLVLVYDIANKVWSTWTGWAPSCFTSYWERGLWLYLFGSGLVGNVYQIGGSTDDGVAFTSTVETKHFPLSGLDHSKRVKWADFSFAGGTIDTTIGLTSISDGTESAEKTVVIPANQDNYPVRLSTPAYARTMGFKIRWVNTGSGGATFLGMDVSFFPRASRPTRVV